MRRWIRHPLSIIILSLISTFAFAQAPQPGLSPSATGGDAGELQNEHFAVLETSCRTPEETIALRDELTRSGALVSIVASPGRMLAWVPPEVRDAVKDTRVSSATGDGPRVLSVSYSSAEFDANRTANQTNAAVSPAARAIVEYLDFIRRPLTEEDRRQIRERRAMIAANMERWTQTDCVELIPYESVEGPRPEDAGLENRVEQKTRLHGYVVHTAFFMESKAGTGSWDWDPVVYNRYRNFYISAINYWTGFAARYGNTITTEWRLYPPGSSFSAVDGEPTSVGEEVYVKEILKPLVNWPWYVPFPNLKNQIKFCQRYNTEMRNAYNADDAVCGFIAYKPSGDADIWPHAKVLTYNNGDREGVYFTMDTRYGQAGLNPQAAPDHNVIAHEIGHLWGAPDEYRKDNCGFSYRGMPNVNCRNLQPAYGRSGTMQGYGGIMVGNYIRGNSLATPVHAGVIGASEAVPVRMFVATPDTVRLDLENCGGSGKQDRVTPFGIPMDFDYCHTVSAPPQYTRGGTTYYFSHWRVKKESGTEADISSYANELPSHAYSSTLTNPVTDVTAVYTDSPPDFLVRNTTVSAHLATAGRGGSPPPAVALKWQNKYDMDDVETTIEYERTSNNWVPLTFEHYLTRPEKVGIGQWTGVLITHIPASGGGKTEIRNNSSYRFRIVGDFNGNPGTPSVAAAVTTRPADPALVYCADANEPNSLASPKLLPASGSDMQEWTLDGAIPIQPIVGEFQFNVPEWDYYRIDVDDVSGSALGERLVLRLRVKEGSDFKPRFRAQRAGESTHVGAYETEDEYILVLLHEGRYIIKVESRVGGGAWNDIVHPTQGYFSFGEYEITLRREQLHIEPDVPELCVRCVKYTFENQPQPGQFVLTPHPKYELFRKGVPRDIPIMFNMYYQVPAGYSFQGFGGDLGTIRDNPATMQINENTDPREYRIHPIIAPIGDGGVELVVLHPEGPDGPRENRQSASPGSVLTATAQVPEGYDFAGWGGDTTAMTNPLPVTMWKSKRLIAHYRKKPCTPTPMTAWLHELSFRNAEQSRVTLEYGMQAGAGDGLEAGQTDLPPVPPPTAFDIRWLNIPGSQGSHTDHRAITASHVFQGQVQTGDKAPVTMEWTSPPVIPGARYTLNIQGGQGSIDMRMQNVYTFSSAGRYIFTIEVEEKGCPEPSEDNDLIVIVDDIDRTDWPCVDLKLKLRDRATGDPRPYADPFKIKVMERMEGTARPMRIDAVQQLDSLLIYRICTDLDDPVRDREIIVVNDNEDEEQREDTTVVNLDPPLPDGDGDPQRFVLRATGDWQMVSIPLDLQNASTSGLFTASDFAMYQFNTDAGTYDPVANMEMGRGYWLKCDPMEEVLVGRTRDALRWDDLSGIGEPYGYGWNMIGALHQSVAVSSIEQQPAGGLQSIFGWDPAQGYIVPTHIESGKGYWARVQPNTTLRIVASGLASGSGTQTAYRRVVGSLDLAGMLVVANRHGHTRTLHVAADHLSESAARLLELPATPPAGVMDARTGRGSAFIFPGEETLRIRADGPCVISAVDAASRMRIELRDEHGTLLHVFDGSAGSVTVPVYGSRTLKLQTAVQPANSALSLGESYPNPFSAQGVTRIPYALAQQGIARLAVYDMLGRRVRVLADGLHAAGGHTVRWDGTDTRGGTLPAGVYTVRLETAQDIISRTITISR